MAYADIDFYYGEYFGDVLDPENAIRWLDRASDELDTLTFGRLATAFPEIEAHISKVMKAVCAIAEALYQIDVQKKAASAQKAQDGSYRGAITSISSGRESISFAAGGASSSVYAAAATNTVARRALIADIAALYISNIPDAQGTNLLYAGV